MGIRPLRRSASGRRSGVVRSWHYGRWASLHSSDVLGRRALVERGCTRPGSSAPTLGTNSREVTMPAFTGAPIKAARRGRFAHKADHCWAHVKAVASIT